MEKKKHFGVLFNRKSGKIVKVLTHDFGDAFLKMFAMGNVSPSRDYIVFSEDGIVTGYFEGKKNDLPFFILWFLIFKYHNIEISDSSFLYFFYFYT